MKYIYCFTNFHYILELLMKICFYEKYWVTLNL